MRRSTLFLGIAAALVIGGAATVYVKGDMDERKHEHHIVLVRNNALCEKSLELASSFTSYAKKDQLTESLVITTNWYSDALEKSLRKEAYELGFTQFEYDSILMKARYDAEMVLIGQIHDAEDPAAKALELALPCVPQKLNLN